MGRTVFERGEHVPAQAENAALAPKAAPDRPLHASAEPSVRVPAYDLRTRVPRAIVALLDRYGEMEFRRLAARVPAAEGVVSMHLERLAAAGIVSAVGRQGTARFRLLDAPQTMVLLAGCTDSWLDRLIDGFADAWFEVGS